MSVPLEPVYAPPTMEGSEGLLAVFVYAHTWPEGATFFTPPDLGLQAGNIKYPDGHEVRPHFHLPRVRTRHGTQEVLFVKDGVVRVRVYSFSQELVAERYLRAGDLVVLVAGGHSLKCFCGAEILEVKTGPYSGRELDKQEFGGEG